MTQYRVALWINVHDEQALKAAYDAQNPLAEGESRDDGIETGDMIVALLDLQMPPGTDWEDIEVEAIQDIGLGDEE